MKYKTITFLINFINWIKFDDHMIMKGWAIMFYYAMVVLSIYGDIFLILINEP
jgi:hypothetical protein